MTTYKTGVTTEQDEQVHPAAAGRVTLTSQFHMLWEGIGLGTWIPEQATRELVAEETGG